jgi:hypothetical protein
VFVCELCLLNPAILAVSRLSRVLGALGQIMLSCLVHMHSRLRSLRQGQVHVGPITWDVLRQRRCCLASRGVSALGKGTGATTDRRGAGDGSQVWGRGRDGGRERDPHRWRGEGAGSEVMNLRCREGRSGWERGRGVARGTGVGSGEEGDGAAVGDLGGTVAAWRRHGLDRAGDNCGLWGWGGRGSPARLAGRGSARAKGGAVVKCGRPPYTLKE